MNNKPKKELRRGGDAERERERGSYNLTTSQGIASEVQELIDSCFILSYGNNDIGLATASAKKMGGRR